MSGFDNEVLNCVNVDFRGVSPIEAQMVSNGQLLIGADSAPFIRAATLSAGANISIMNAAGAITISASGGGSSSATNIGVDAFTAPGTNPVVADGGDVITITGGQVASGTVGANVIRTNSTAANNLAIEIQQATSSGASSASANGVCHFNSAQFIIGANGFVSAAASVPTTFNADSGSAVPVGNALSVLGGEGIDTSGTGSTLTISGEDASDVNKGIASFAAADFDVAAGAVSLEDTVVKSVTTDSGSATPAGHIFSIVGGIDVSTSATGSVVTIDFDSTGLGSTITGDTGGGLSPTAGNWNVLGGEGIDTSGTGSTLTISGENASDVNKGIASFSAADFNVTAGAVELEDTVVKSVTTDSGSATPAGHTFSIVGTGGITTSGTGSTVTVDGSGISGGGGVAQQVRASTSAYFAISTIIPRDDTIPQQTEGVEILTVSITPTSADSVLVVEATTFLYLQGTNMAAALALFRDSTSDAIGAVTGARNRYDDVIIATAPVIRSYVSAGSTSTTTFKLRIGTDSESKRVDVNGNGSRYYGGVASTTLTVTEYIE